HTRWPRDWSSDVCSSDLAVVGLVQFGLLETLEHWSLDRLFEWRGPRTPHLSVVIVTIDESSFAELNEQWPFPRAMHGQLLTKIADRKSVVQGKRAGGVSH